jgi:phage FluMu gp28-like protein
MAKHPVVFCEKSRRIGMTWGIGADAVLNAASSKAAGGMDIFYIGFNLDMTREFIDVCAMWAKAFHPAASAVEEFIFKDQDKDGETREIQAFRIRFDSGYDICALTSRPRSLRGHQGYIIIDEAAFHDDLKELMKAALANLMWGGKVFVISTHDGVDNVFNQYIQDAHAGKNPYKVIKVDFDEALKDGLYQRICMVTHKIWSQEAEKVWRDDIVNLYGEGAEEELFCIPRLSSGAYLSGQLIEQRMQSRPILRLKCDDDFVKCPDAERVSFIKDWCETHLKHLLKSLNPKLQSYLGEDFGRSGDLSVLWPLQIQQDLKRDTPFVIELRNVPFSSQRQIVWYLIDHLPLFSGAAFDARGNGQQLAEETAQRYGGERIHQVMISTAWYQDSFPKYKAALEDDMIILPQDADILTDHRAVKMIRGIPTIPDLRSTGADGGKRHGDSVIAAVMAYWASLQDYVEYGYDTPKHQNHSQSNHDEAQTSRFQKGAW